MSFVGVRTRRDEGKEVLTDYDLNKVITLELTETDTIWLLDMPGVSVSAEGEETQAIKERNEKYKAVSSLALTSASNQ